MYVYVYLSVYLSVCVCMGYVFYLSVRVIIAIIHDISNNINI